VPRTAPSARHAAPRTGTGGRICALLAVLFALVLGAAVTVPALADPGRRTEPAARGASAPSGRTLFASPGVDLRRLLASLRPGDTLRLEPGTYDPLAPGTANPDLLRPHLTRGTAEHPIRVTAADRARPPLLVGAIQFDHADYWTFSHLRIVGNVAHTPSLVFNGGTGWLFADSEVSGAAETGALANVAIEGATADGTMPTHWRFARNCVHGGGDDPAVHPGRMHEIYVTAQGDAFGHITRNVLYDTPDGAAVKVGFGGVIGALGASDVLIAGNTMVDNGRQVLVFGRVDRVSIQDNLMVDTTYVMSDGRTRPAIYLNRLSGMGSVVGGNYVWASNRSIFDLASAPGSWQNAGGNAVRQQPPRLAGTGCAMHPTGSRG
jgi:hypothetical protein